MREIIHLQVGECGNQVGATFLEKVCAEHGIDPMGTYQGDYEAQLDKINVYFHETQGHGYIPRAILTDLDPRTLDSIRGVPFGKIFKPDNLISGQLGAGANNRFSDGHYLEGAEMSDSVLDAVRKEAEGCDSMQGFQMTHSLGGGTGSGMGTLLISKIKDEYPDKIIETFSVFPSPLVSDTVVQPYNCVLATAHLIANADIVHVFDNEALYHICEKNLSIENITYGDLNHIISSAISDITCGLRFSGSLNYDMRKLAVTMVPFLNLHFLINASAPLVSRKNYKTRSLTVPELTHEMFHSKNSLCATKSGFGKHLAAFALFRGKVSKEEVHEQMLNIQDKKSSLFIDWIPDNKKYSIYEVPLKGLKSHSSLVTNPTTIQGLKSHSSLITNSTTIQEMLRRVAEQFSQLWKRKAYLYGHSIGMDQLEYKEAESLLTDLIFEYQQYSDINTEL